MLEYSDIGRVYPRVCGGTVHPAGRQALVLGLSPRVRGNRGNGRRFVLSPRVPVLAYGLSPRVRGNPLAN